jgi:hypothetical protein
MSGPICSPGERGPFLVILIRIFEDDAFPDGYSLLRPAAAGLLMVEISLGSFMAIAQHATGFVSLTARRVKKLIYHMTGLGIR